MSGEDVREDASSLICWARAEASKMDCLLLEHGHSTSASC